MTDVLALDDQAKQTVFAKLVGVSQPAIAKHLSEGRLPSGGTYRQWLKAYTDHIRNEAAGRGGSLQEELAAARIEETRMKAANARLDYEAKVGSLVPVQWAEQSLLDWAAFANRELASGVRELVSEIQSEYKIEIKDELVTNRVRAVIERIGGHAEKLASNVDVGGG